MPDLLDSVRLDQLRVICLERLLSMKLAAFRTIDNVHIRDMLRVGLIGESLVSELSDNLRAKLGQIVNDPEERLG
jgi:hypothetical protein